MLKRPYALRRVLTGQTHDGWSATPLDVQERLVELRDADETAALATVVDVEGSAFRRPGAKMVLSPHGGHTGVITAGCLEGPVAELATAVHADGDTILRTFDMMDDDEWGLGLGCNGIIDVFVEPVDASLDRALDALASGEPAGLVTVVESSAPAVEPGDRAALVDGDLRPVEARSSLPEPMLEDVSAVVRDCAERGTTAIRESDLEDGTVRVFVDGVEPPPELLVFGGQPDSIPVVKLARDVGFRVNVATARGGLADPDRFPGAAEVLAVRPNDLDEHVDEGTFVVVMSHNVVDDELAMASLAETDVPYVGLMGPRDRFEKLRDDLENDGVVLSEAFLERVGAPVGLDLGGDAPMEIALSIVSELLAVRNDRAGGRLRDRSGSIHGEHAHVTEE